MHLNIANKFYPELTSSAGMASVQRTLVRRNNLQSASFRSHSHFHAHQWVPVSWTSYTTVVDALDVTLERENITNDLEGFDIPIHFTISLTTLFSPSNYIRFTRASWSHWHSHILLRNAIRTRRKQNRRKNRRKMRMSNHFVLLHFHCWCCWVLRMDTNELIAVNVATGR